jgi:hypothetical protein
MNAVLNFLMEKPYKEVAEVVKLMEGTCINVPPTMNILRDLSRAVTPTTKTAADAPPPAPRGPVLVESGADTIDGTME